MPGKDTTEHHIGDRLDSADYLYVVSREAQDVGERLARTREQLEAFQQIALVVGSEASIESVLKMICDKTTQLMRAERTTIFLVEEENGQLYLNSVIAERSGVIRLKFGQGIAGTVAKRRQNLNIKDVYKCELFDPSFDKLNDFVTKSCLCVPILNIQRELLGVVQVINKNVGYFTLNDEEMLASICAQIGVSLTQHQFYMTLLHRNSELSEAKEKLQRRNEELDMLYALERDAAVATDLQSLVKRMLERCLQAFHIRYAAIYMIVGSENRLFAADLFNPGHEPAYVPRLMAHCPKFLKQALNISTCTMLSVRDLESLPEQTEHILGHALNQILIAPLSSEDKAFGALILGSRKLINPFSPYDAKLASLFAAHIAPSIGAQFDREANEKKQRLSTIGQMMSSLMHDMKTPLANISGYVELMTTQKDPAKRSDYATVVDRQIETLKNMSTEILDFARGQSAVILQKIQLSPIIVQSIDLLKSEMERRQIEITYENKYDGEIYCDAIKIQRVIINLAKNAMEALDSGGHIVISTYSDEKHIYLSIQDDGPGIPEEISKTLFDAFVTSGKKGGTGLGLSIVKKIIDEHHATITQKNIQPHGTAFIMAFPISMNH